MFAFTWADSEIIPSPPTFRYLVSYDEVNWDEPDTTPVPSAIFANVIELFKLTSVPAIVIELFWMLIPSICADWDTTLSPSISKYPRI